MELSVETAAGYLRRRGILLKSVHELGGGVSNVVLQVEPVEGEPFVLKQALPRLRVNEEWVAERSRIFREVNALQDSAGFLLSGSVPSVLWVDESNYLFAMKAVSGKSWKSALLAGEVEEETARSAGRQMALFIRSTWQSQFYREKYGDQTIFEQLRVNPYYRTIATRHPDIAPKVGALIEESSERRFSLVHGDWSPKNILLAGGCLCLIDFEVVHFGDPTFDSAFLISHLLLKRFVLPKYCDEIEQITRIFWSELVRALPVPALSFFERATLQHLGPLMLARVDGKSPVEYLSGELLRGYVRAAAKELISCPPENLEECLERLNHAIAPKLPPSREESGK